MSTSAVALFAPFIAAGVLGVWALVLMYLERRDERRRPH